ncbi:predicted protein, partial [Nematostella vectensis]
LRFLVGVGATGFMLTRYLVIMEMAGPRYRTLLGVTDDAFFAVSGMLCTMVAYFVREWRTLLLIYTFPGVIFLLLAK